MLKSIKITQSKKEYFYAFLFAIIIFFIPTENLSDRDAYINWFEKVAETGKFIQINSFNDIFWLIGSEQVWNQILKILTIFDPEKALIGISYLIAFLLSLSVFKNTKSNRGITFLLLTNIFILTASLNHIRSGLAMGLIMTTYRFPELDRSFRSRLIRFLSLGIHFGGLIYIIIDYMELLLNKIRDIFGRSSILIIGGSTLVSASILFSIFTKYAPNDETMLGRGSSLGLIFYLFILLAIICSGEKERNDSYISIILLSIYTSCYLTYPPVSRVIEMGFPFIIISILNMKSKNKKYLLPLFLIGSIAQTIINSKTLFI